MAALRNGSKCSHTTCRLRISQGPDNGISAALQQAQGLDKRGRFSKVSYLQMTFVVIGACLLITAIKVSISVLKTPFRFDIELFKGLFLHTETVVRLASWPVNQ